MEQPNKVSLKFEINQEFLDSLNELMTWPNGPQTIDNLEHFRNALVLYGQIVEGIAEGKTPALIDKGKSGADILDLPNLLILFKHAKDVELNKKSTTRIDLTKNML